MPIYRWVSLALAALVLASSAHPARAQKTEAAFPKDPAVLDLRRDFGAKGDGKTDDTEALQRGLDASCGMGGASRVLYIPNGTYRLTRTVVVRHPVGPWLYGQSRDGVILRLDDGVKDCNALLRTHPNESGPTSADWFMRNIRNLTLDVGNNPQTDGIRYFATNSGILRNVRIVGNGRVGVNSGFMQQNGPNLVQDVVIEGFETGVLSQWIWGQTLSRVTIRNCRKVGVEVSANTVAIENLVVERTPLAISVDYPNDWTWWGGVVAIVGGRFEGGDPAGPAIKNRSVLYARSIQARGYGMLIASETPGGNVTGGRLAGEYLSHPARTLAGGAVTSLMLPIKPEPKVPWELDTTKWVCANDFGAVAGDNKDDTAAIQRAIDAAAAAKKTTVYLRGISGPDPNWYSVEGEIRVHGSVRHILGLGFGRILAGEKGQFVVDDRSAPVVKFQNIDAFGGPPVRLVNKGSRKMVVESCGVRIIGAGTGDIFATDCPSLVEIRSTGQRFWARHLNPEGDSDTGLVRNKGGLVWVMGSKFEGRGVRYRVEEGGRTEVFGMFVYGPGIPQDDRRPMFDVDGGMLTVAGLREIVFDAPTYHVKVRERIGSEIRSLSVDQEPGWIGWSLYGSSAPAAAR